MSIFAFLNRNLKDIWVKVFKNGPSKVVCGRQPLKNMKWYGLYNKFIMSWTAHLNILVHDMINLLYYEYWTDKQKYFYIYDMVCLGRPYHFKFFKSCPPQILLGPFLNTLTHFCWVTDSSHNRQRWHYSFSVALLVWLD